MQIIHLYFVQTSIISLLSVILIGSLSVAETVQATLSPSFILYTHFQHRFQA
jgi:hypothetical protein